MSASNSSCRRRYCLKYTRLRTNTLHTHRQTDRQTDRHRQCARHIAGPQREALHHRPRATHQSPETYGETFLALDESYHTEVRGCASAGQVRVADVSCVRAFRKRSGATRWRRRGSWCCALARTCSLEPPRATKPTRSRTALAPVLASLARCAHSGCDGENVQGPVHGSVSRCVRVCTQRWCVFLDTLPCLQTGMATGRTRKRRKSTWTACGTAPTWICCQNQAPWTCRKR